MYKLLQILFFLQFIFFSFTCIFKLDSCFAATSLFPYSFFWLAQLLETTHDLASFFSFKPQYMGNTTLSFFFWWRCALAHTHSLLWVKVESVEKRSNSFFPCFFFSPQICQVTVRVLHNKKKGKKLTTDSSSSWLDSFSLEVTWRTDCIVRIGIKLLSWLIRIQTLKILSHTPHFPRHLFSFIARQWSRTFSWNPCFCLRPSVGRASSSDRSYRELKHVKIEFPELKTPTSPRKRKKNWFKYSNLIFSFQIWGEMTVQKKK